MSGLRIGVDSRLACWTQPTGTGRYTRQLLASLATLGAENAFKLVVVNSRHGAIAPLDTPSSNFDIVRLPGAGRTLKLRWLARCGPDVSVETGPLDVFHSPSVDFMAAGHTPRVLTLHDLCFLTHPQLFPVKDRLMHRLGLRHMLAVTRSIITVSEATARTATELLGIPKARLTVIPLAPARVFTPTPQFASDVAASKLSRGDPYVLFVGTIEPRKGIEELVSAFCLARRRAALPHRLLIAGGSGWKSGPASRAIAAAAPEGVTYLGYVPDPVIAALMRGTDCFVYPSLVEGFGLPALEAMACGAPVIVSDAEALVEVVGDAAEIVEAGNRDALATKLAAVLAEPARAADLSRRGRARAGKFDWRETARATLRVYEGVA